MYVYINIDIHVNIYLQKTNQYATHTQPILIMHIQMDMGYETWNSTIPRKNMKRPHINAKVHILDHPLSME